MHYELSRDIDWDAVIKVVLIASLLSLGSSLGCASWHLKTSR